MPSDLSSLHQNDDDRLSSLIDYVNSIPGPAIHSDSGSVYNKEEVINKIQKIWGYAKEFKFCLGTNAIDILTTDITKAYQIREKFKKLLADSIPHPDAANFVRAHKSEFDSVGTGTIEIPFFGRE